MEYHDTVPTIDTHTKGDGEFVDIIDLEEKCEIK